MKKIYYLSTCQTCTKILNQLDTHKAILINLKKQNIGPEDLDLMYKNTGSYESLFNKRAQKWKSLPESERPQKDEQFRDLILNEYTFLKRPAVIADGQSAAGNDQKTVEKMIQLINES